MTAVGSYSVVQFPKTVSIDDTGTSLSFIPTVDPSRAFDIDYAEAEIMITDLLTAVPAIFPSGPSNTNGANGSITVTIPAGVYNGTETTTAIDTDLVSGNLKPGITILGVTSNMPVGVDITGASGVTHIPVAAGYYDGSTFVDYTP